MAETKTPAKTASGDVAAQRSSRAEVDEFLEQVRSLAPAPAGRGRLIFAMDATMSRQPSWDLALELQADMFKAVKAVGGLDVQLVYFRGYNECQASKWVGDPDALARLMRGRTVIAIAHRLSTVRSFDRIVVLQAARIVEDGPPDQLMRRRGPYRDLLRRQMNVKEAA